MQVITISDFRIADEMNFLAKLDILFLKSGKCNIVDTYN